MADYDETTYGEEIAAAYDEFYATVDPAEIEMLAELAGNGRALELAIGTGRVALPLQERGVTVSGIDASQAMVARLREKPGGADIAVTMGNFADVAVEGQFDLIYVVFNTFFALLTQEEQIRCFGNVAARLAPEGSFLIEAFVPDLTRYDRGQRVSAIDLEGDAVRLEVSAHDPVRQQVRSKHLLLSESGIRFFPVRLRYVWPSEMDLMARLARFNLAERWGGWQREPFTAQSGRHISVYRTTGR
jgi:SAM-dependent methyltransferase